MINSKIKITNNSKNPVTIDIEGVIGVLEEHQFANPETVVATYEKLKTKITKIKEIDAKEVVVNIRSAGGNVNDAILIYEALKNLPAKITTRCYGYVASAATIIAQAASENRREIASSALYLIHNSIGNIEGNCEEIKQTLNLIQITDKTIAGIYAQRANKNIDEFSSLMNENGGKGRWLSPNEALEHNLVDAVIQSENELSNSAEIVETLGLPPIPKQKNTSQSTILKRLNQKWREISQIIKFINNTKTNPSQEIKQPNNEMNKQQVIRSKEELIAMEMSEKIKHTTPTNTTPKEDPPMDEIGGSANANAYDSDSKQFKN